MSKLQEPSQNFVFPAVDFQTWEKEVEKSLKGITIDQLTTTTYDNIKIKPIYTKEDTKAIPFINELPGFDTFVRGTSTSGYTKDSWHICQEIDTDNLKEFNSLLKEALAHGQTMIHLNTKKITNVDHMKTALDEIPVSNYPLMVDSNYDSSSFLSQLETYYAKLQYSLSSLNGTIGMDPISYLCENGALPVELPVLFDKMADSIKWAKKHNTQVRTILIKGHPHHNGGSNCVQELAFTLAAATEYLNELIDRGLTIDEISPRMTFSFSIGSNVFLEIAKIRAARILWSTIIHAYGGNEDLGKMMIHGRTSSFTKTIYDPYVNMLRATTEAFSAIIGGVDSLHVSAFDEPIKSADSFSNRIARNTQSILKYEAYLNKVIDPGGGSWYIESLTNEMTNSAWELFKDIEGKGGMIKSLSIGFVQDEINKVLQERQKNVDLRKDKIVGTNVYANLNEMTLDELKPNDNLGKIISSSYIKIKKIPQTRLSEKFESLRLAANVFEKRGGYPPKIGLINLGQISKHKVRADFITGFFEAGGFQVEKTDGYFSINEAIEGALKTNLSTYVICGTDDDYVEMAETISVELLKQRPSIQLYIAGKQKGESERALRKAGITEFIHQHTDCYELLRKIQREMGVTASETTN